MMKTKPCPECGKSLHAEAVKCSCGWQDARAAARVAKSEHMACGAYGCCLPGTMYDSSSGSEGWCYLHAAHRETIDIQRLTRAINMRRKLFDGVAALYAEVDQVTFWTEIPGRYARPFRDSRTDLLPTHDERKKTRQAWLSRVRRDLEGEVLADCGIEVRRAAPLPERRGYAPSDDDIEAAREAEAAIDSGAWKRVGEAVAA